MDRDTRCDLPALSVVFPVFNEEASVGELVSRVFEACKSIGVSWEVVAVNDGSTDATLERLVQHSTAHPELRVIDLFRNVGHMSALAAGVQCAHGKAVVVMDGDLQDPPELIPALFVQWKQGAEIVEAQRARRREGICQRFFSYLFYRLLSYVAETAIPKNVGTYCLLDRRVVDALNAMPERQRFFVGLRALIGGRRFTVSYDRPRRRYGKSRVGFRGLLRLARMALISFSKVPLRYASYLSLLTSFLFLCIGIVAVLIRLFTNLAIPGWATFATLIGFFGFVQSLVLAVMSEYIAVIFDETKDRPLFVIRREIRSGDSSVP